jgi:Flp pilus assembly protein CpaB
VAVSAPKKLREAGSPKPVRRRVWRRLSTTHVLIAIVVILAFVLNLLVLSDRDSTTLVAVADRSLPAGSTLEPTALRLVSIDSSFEGLPALVGSDELERYEGWIVDRSVPEGSVLEEANLVEPTSGDGLRAMSLPIGVAHAAGGSLSPGDRVDVISVVDGEARFVAVDLEVTAVADDPGGSIGSVSQYHVVVSVDAKEALGLARALDQGSMEIVRSTGAAGVGVGGLEDG